MTHPFKIKLCKNCAHIIIWIPIIKIWDHITLYGNHYIILSPSPSFRVKCPCKTPEPMEIEEKYQSS